MKIESNRSQRGISLIQATVFIAVVIVGGLAVYQATQTGKESLDKARSIGNAGVLADLSLDGLRTLLLETGPQRKDGVCRLFDTPMKTGGVGQIYVNVPVSTSTILDSEWSRAFSSTQWKEESGIPECTKSAFNRCLSPEDSLGLAPDFKSKKPFVLLTLVPVEMRNRGATAFQFIPPPATGATAVNARDVGFAVNAQVFVREKEKDSPPENPRYRSVVASRAYASIWAGQISCGFTTSENKYLLLNPSAIGTGTAETGTLFSAVGLMSTGEDKVLDVAFTQFENTRSKIVSNKLVSDYSSGAVSSVCKEAQYRCGNDPSGRLWTADSLSIEARVKYVLNKKITANSIVARPELFFARADGTGAIRGNASYYQSGAALPAGSLVTYMLNPQTVIARFSNSDTVCNGICGQGNFNTTGSVYRPAMENFPRSDFSAVGSKIGPQVDENSATYCNCCAVKQCQRLGFQSTIHCPNLPPEPLDSRIPECAAQSLPTVYGNSNLTSLNSSGMDANSCIKAALVGGSLVYSSEDCSRERPVLCYHQGGSVVARALGTSNLPSGTFDQSIAQCYNLGRERLEKAELDEKLTMQSNTSMIALLAGKVSGGFYDFVNNRSAGVFVAPETGKQVEQATASMNTYSDSRGYWVNLRTDSRKRVFAPPHTIAPSQISNLGYQFDVGSRVSVYQDTSSWTQGPQVVVAHSALLAAPIKLDPANLPSGFSARFLCRNLSDGQLFATTATSNNVNDGRAKCEAENGIFLPPLRPMEWQYAFILSELPGTQYPWPAQGLLPKTGINQPLWVGFRDNGGTWELNLGPPSGTTRIDQNGAASTATSATHRLCVSRAGPSGLTPTFTLIGNSQTCSSPSTPYGPMDSTAIVDNADLQFFLAQQRATGAIGAASAIDTSF